MPPSTPIVPRPALIVTEPPSTFTPLEEPPDTYTEPPVPFDRLAPIDTSILPASPLRASPVAIDTDPVLAPADEVTLTDDPCSDIEPPSDPALEPPVTVTEPPSDTPIVLSPPATIASPAVPRPPLEDPPLIITGPELDLVLPMPD